MKLFKRLAMVAMAITLCFGAGAALASCSKDAPASSTSEATSATYQFKVLKNDETPATGYQVQLCIKNADGSLGSCLMGQKVGADGTVSYPVQNPSYVYEIHILDAESNALKKTEYTTIGEIPANYNGGVISVTVNK